jgi:hypothetical protein
MKKVLYLLMVFSFAFILSDEVKALSIPADGEWHVLDSTDINHPGVYTCKSSDSSVVQTNIKSISSTEYKCAAKTSKADANVTIEWYVTYSGSKMNYGSSSLTATAVTNNANNVDANHNNIESTADVTDLCDATKNPGVMGAFKLGSIAIDIIKIVVPILLIVFGMIDMAKIVVDGKDDSIQKSALTFGKRAGAAIIIFLVPTIVLNVFDMVEGWTGVEYKYQACLDCLLDTSKCPENISITGN